jgi:hypothetical protein
MNQQQQPQLNIDLKNTQKVETPDGNFVVAEGLILRKASKFALGTSEDALIPIPVFYDVKTGRILKDTLPKELVDEYDTIEE